ncbi:accessory gene regulator ArgB-like protein [Paenibacillus sp. JSM ZJ436]|uniref:accessory gene regulator ArgB-like protein n=1 Tax=Paenibacillus sp. JSM ZJ436 TaxID=3376190 RepID=UPI0037A7861B
MIKFIEFNSIKISEKLLKRYADEMPSYDVTRYAVKFILSNIVPILISVIIGYILGIGSEVLIFIAGFVSLRMVSGGFHFKSAELCFIISTAMCLCAPYVAMQLSNTIYYNLISVLLALIFAPSNIEKQTRVGKNKHIYFKWASLIVIVIAVLINNPVLNVAMLLQSIMLIRLNLKGGEKR